MRYKRGKGKVVKPVKAGEPSNIGIANLDAPKVTTEVEQAQQAWQAEQAQAEPTITEQAEPVAEAEAEPKGKAVAKPPLDRYSSGYKDGFAYGLGEGKKLAEAKLDLQITLATRNAFDSGVRHIVTLAEENLAKTLGFRSRDELVSSGKLPDWWIRTLAFHATSGELPPVKTGESPKQIPSSIGLLPSDVEEIEEEP